MAPPAFLADAAARCSDAYYTILDTVRKHRLTSAALAVVVALAIGTAILFSSGSSSAPPLVSGVPAGPCAQAVTTIERVTVQYPASTHPSPVIRKSVQSLDAAIQSICPTSVSLAVQNKVLEPWVRSQVPTPLGTRPHSTTG
jgi:hypothetical protein